MRPYIILRRHVKAVDKVTRVVQNNGKLPAQHPLPL